MNIIQEAHKRQAVVKMANQNVVKQMGLGTKPKKETTRKHDWRYPELLVPDEKVQIDVKEVSYCCLKGDLKRDGKHLYQWTAIDECTRVRFIYGFEEHTPENTVKFSQMLQKVFPFIIQTAQTDNGTEFTYKYIIAYLYDILKFFTVFGSHLLTTQIYVNRLLKMYLTSTEKYIVIMYVLNTERRIFGRFEINKGII